MTVDRMSHIQKLIGISLAACLFLLVVTTSALAGPSAVISMTVYEDGGAFICQYVGKTAFCNGKVINLGGGHLLTLDFKSNGASNCPGGGGCTPGASTEWEVKTSNQIAIPLDAILHIGISVPGEICQSFTDAAYTVDQDCPSQTFMAHGLAKGTRIHRVKFLPGDTLAMGSCCGDFTEAECISWVTEEVCLDLGGTFNGEGSDCITGPCGPEATIPAISEYGWAGLVAIFVAGGTLVLWQRRRRDA